jgi:hypothetical protein
MVPVQDTGYFPWIILLSASDTVHIVVRISKKMVNNFTRRPVSKFINILLNLIALALTCQAGFLASLSHFSPERDYQL